MSQLNFEDNLESVLDAIEDKSGRTTKEILDKVKEPLTEDDSQGAYNKMIPINDIKILRICHANSCGGEEKTERRGIENHHELYKQLENSSLKNLFPNIFNAGEYSYTAYDYPMKKLWSIQERAGDKELYDFVKEVNRSSPDHIKNNFIFKIIIQIFMACLAISELGYQHLDLKMENIMIDTKTDKNIKIIDFGMMKPCPPHGDPPTKCRYNGGTPGYSNLGSVCAVKYRQNSDFHAFATITYMIFTWNKPPTQSQTEEEEKKIPWSRDKWINIQSRWGNVSLNKFPEIGLIKDLIAGIGNNLPGNMLCKKSFEDIKNDTKVPLAKLILHTMKLHDMAPNAPEELPDEVDTLKTEDAPEELPDEVDTLKTEIDKLDDEQFRNFFNFEKSVIINLLSDMPATSPMTEEEEAIPYNKQVEALVRKGALGTHKFRSPSVLFSEDERGNPVAEKFGGGKKKTRKKKTRKKKTRKKKKTKRRKTKKR